jgi:hypothetical protein
MAKRGIVATIFGNCSTDTDHFNKIGTRSAAKITQNNGSTYISLSNCKGPRTSNPALTYFFTNIDYNLDLTAPVNKTNIQDLFAERSVTMLIRCRYSLSKDAPSIIVANKEIIFSKYCPVSDNMVEALKKSAECDTYLAENFCTDRAISPTSIDSF